MIFIEKFWKRVNKTGNCWIWTGAKNNAGYGSFTERLGPNKKKTWLAHRLSYIIHNPTKEIENPFKVIRHLCNNTSCVNPLHLIDGTQLQNVWDSIASNRFHKAVGERHGKSKLSENIAKLIFNSKHLNAEDLAKKFNVNLSCIYKIWNKETWKHIHE